MTHTDKGFTDLQIAIFRVAIYDDCKKIQKKIGIELEQLGLDRKKIIEFIKSKETKINQLIRRHIAREALNYPGTTWTQAESARNSVYRQIMKDWRDEQWKPAKDASTTTLNKY